MGMGVKGETKRGKNMERTAATEDEKMGKERLQLLMERLVEGTARAAVEGDIGARELANVAYAAASCGSRSARTARSPGIQPPLSFPRRYSY